MSPPSVAIPDNDTFGITNTLTIADSGTISDLNIYVNIEHTWVGDIIARLIHEETDTTVTLIDRPGRPGINDFGCSGDYINAILDEQAADPVEDECADPPPAISGTFFPNESLDAYVGEDLQGDWLLVVSDNAGGDDGGLNGWCMFAYTNP
jgi:subtilisin-like proprotein convertase family protein